MSGAVIAVEKFSQTFDDKYGRGVWLQPKSGVIRDRSAKCLARHLAFMIFPDAATNSIRLSIRLRVRNLALAVRVTRKTDLAPYRFLL
jgi:hypothetical protein